MLTAFTVKTKMQTQRAYQKGVGLIEVMIAVLVLGVGLLGILTLQNNALKLNQVSYYYSQASVMVSDITEKVRSNIASSNSYSLSFGETPTSNVDCIATPCRSEQLAQWQLAQWRSRVAQMFPSGDAQIEISTDINTPSNVAITFVLDSADPVQSTQRIQVEFRL